VTRLESQRRLKKLLNEYFHGLSGPLAWCTSAGPAEILRALGFEVYFPENHGALLGASRTAGKYIPRAHQAGYANEVCSYLTSDIGSHLMKETPLKEAYGLAAPPKPDLIVFNTNQCREVAEWFGFYAREYGCPLVGIFPPRHLEEVTQADIDNVAQQLEALIRVGERVIGKSLDREALSKTVRLSREASDLWKQALQSAQHVPSPLTFWDGTILMAPIVMLRGTLAAVDFYHHLVDELHCLTKVNAAAVADEEVRLYWEGMPIWGRLRSLSDLMAENRTSVVASTYCNSWVFDDFDATDPLRSMAAAYTKIFINRGEEYKLKTLKQTIAEYGIDGIIFHDAKTCFNNSNCRFGLPGRLTTETGTPTLIIDGDLNDLRFFSDGQAQTRFETFVEQVKQSRSR
jgi:benzoyl-CoA reductase/2-hydroxyglutaryl-CoA dehydratase subunit BcrC/BadD/HgdB